MPNPWTRGLAILVASGVGLGPAASARAMLAPGAESEPAVVLGLDTDDSRQGAALTQALRRAFAKRGLSGGDEANLTELRLALGCSSNQPSCLAGGGEMLGARRLIYGELERGGAGGWTLTLSILEVDSRETSSIDVSLSEGELESRNIDATAERVAESLVPGTAGGEPQAASGSLSEPPPPPPALPDDADDPGQVDGEKGRVWLGLQRPTPRWKWAGFGASAGLFVGSLAATIGTGMWLTSKDRGFRRELLDAAEASLTDSNSLNDVDPNLPEGVSLCEYAREQPVDPDTNEPQGLPGQVRNASVAGVCEKGETITRVQLGMGVLAAVSAVSTLVFTGLLVIHRGPRPPRKAAPQTAWQRHRMQLALDPGRSGAMLRVGGRF
ncbi:MAG: hypothetical protein KC501_31050 [Myxococcales bacterium]|nr:hypothetical protein [Myxococcales bacterium]